MQFFSNAGSDRCRWQLQQIGANWQFHETNAPKMIDGTSPHHSSGATLKPRQNTIITHKNRLTRIDSSKKIGQAIAPKGPPNTCGEGRIKVGVSGFHCVFWPFSLLLCHISSETNKVDFQCLAQCFCAFIPNLVVCLFVLVVGNFRTSAIFFTFNALPRCSLRPGTLCHRRTAPARPPRRPSTQTRGTCCAKARCCWSHRLFPRCWDERSLAAFPTNGSRSPARPSTALV